MNKEIDLEGKAKEQKLQSKPGIYRKLNRIFGLTKAIVSKDKGTKAFVIAVLAICGVMISGGFAWFVIEMTKEASSDETEVMAPYYLYLLDESASQSLELAVGNIHPGETKQAVICVSNNDPANSDPGFEIGRNTSFDYTIELGYTTNLPISYNIYSLTEATADDYAVAVQDKDGNITYMKEISVDGTNGNVPVAMPHNAVDSALITDTNRNKMYTDTLLPLDLNLGEYKVYTEDEFSNSLELTATVTDGRVDYDNNYYMITFTLESDMADFLEYTREIDMVYVICQAKQPKPEKKD